MHIIQTDCTITYEGRGSTFMGRGVRLVMVKADNTVLVHQDRDVRPVNYMPRASSVDFVERGDGTHLVARGRDETIDVHMHEILYEHHLDVDDSEELERHGTEVELQGWLSGEGFAETFPGRLEFVCREYETGKGRVDLLAIDRDDGQAALIEVKRVARRSDVFQLVRYQSAVSEHAGDSGTFATTMRPDAVRLDCSAVVDPHLFLVASRFLPRVRSEAAKWGIECVLAKVPQARRDGTRDGGGART